MVTLGGFFFARVHQSLFERNSCSFFWSILISFFFHQSLFRKPVPFLLVTSGGTSTNRPKKHIPGGMIMLSFYFLGGYHTMSLPLSEIDGVTHTSVGLGHWSYRDIGVEIGRDLPVLKLIGDIDHHARVHDHHARVQCT